MESSADILRLLPADLTDRNRRRIEQAIAAAQRLYDDTPHWSGVSILEHVFGVGAVLLRFSPDPDALIATLLHHALDEGGWSGRQLEEAFGKDVRRIVDGIHLLSRVTLATRRMSIDNLRHMFLRISSDVRVVLIVLCAKVYSLGRIRSVPAGQRAAICRDVLRLYAPVAARLGIYALKHELESLAFPIAYPTDAERIQEQLAEVHRRSGRFLEKAAASLRAFLKESGVDCRVEVREKQPYSLFVKMGEKSVTSVREVYDLFALRVIVADEAQCYQVLGLLHRIGHPVPNRFKDYVAFPKPNGYQSLHTTVARLPGIPEGTFTEVQIRTERMHREADYGVAAHWSYKERGSAKKADLQFQRILSLKHEIERAKTPFLRDNIFVLTPRGDVFELPEGSTPLDFAFHVHTDLGIAFRSATVNGVIVPMDYRLENGDVVEIQKQRNPRPSPRWLQLLRTAPARSRLKRYLAIKDRPGSLALGRDLLNAELEKMDLPPLDGDYSLLKSIDGHRAPFGAREEFLARIGQGALKFPSALAHIDALELERGGRKKRAAAEPPPARGSKTIRVEGGVPLPHKYAKCCKPEAAPGGRIEGVIGRSGDVRIHRATCRLLRNVNPERRIGARWA